MAKVKPVKNHNSISDDSFNSIKFDVAIVLFFLAVCYWVMKPVIEMPPQRDSGCFLYIGQNWLKGMIPYRDMWDHKGPVLYLLNAIGVLINGAKGVMVLQVILTSLGFFYMYKVCRGYINFIASALLTLSGFFFLFFLHQSGNQSEQWAIFFQGFSLYLYFKWNISRDNNGKTFIAIGFLMACSFLLRPNQVALWMTIGIAELSLVFLKKQTLKMLLPKVGYGLSGFLIPVLLFSVYFMFHHAFDEMWDCLFRFNFIYTGKSETSLSTNILFGIKSIPFLWVIMAGIVLNLIVYIVKFKEIGSAGWFLFLFSVVWLKLEIILSVMAGSGHLHYYVQWILPLLLVICSILNAFKLVFKSNRTNIYAQITMTVLLSVALFYKVKPLRTVQMDDMVTYHDINRFREKVVERIVNETDDSDYVLEWGMVDGINFMSERKSPTRYFYPYALDTKGYTNKGKITEFLDEVKLKKPKLIIDASCMERFPQIDSINRDSLYRAKPNLKGLIPDNINEFYAYVESKYRYEGNVGFMLIFKRKE